MIAIIDYGVGNLFSLQSSCKYIGQEAVVTADPALIEAADQIILINDGRIEATGTQEELLQKSDLYRKMWQAHIAAKEDEENA